MDEEKDHWVPWEEYKKNMPPTNEAEDIANAIAHSLRGMIWRIVNNKGHGAIANTEGHLAHAIQRALLYK